MATFSFTLYVFHKMDNTDEHFHFDPRHDVGEVLSEFKKVASEEILREVKAVQLWRSEDSEESENAGSHEEKESSLDGNDNNNSENNNVSLPSYNPISPRIKPALSSSDFPSLEGAVPGVLSCKDEGYPDVSAQNSDNLLVYWNEPQGTYDYEYTSPFDHGKGEDGKPKKYITFEGDQGGWNNIRMSMESTMVYAYATDRILVMPPTQPFYLVGKEGSKNYDDFFHFDDEEFRKHITIISMEEFLAEHGGGGPDSALGVSIESYAAEVGISPTKLRDGGRECSKRRKDKSVECDAINEYMRKAAYVLPYHGSKHCMVFSETTPDPESKQIKDFCVDREMMLYTDEIREQRVIHFATAKREHRLLTHFYEFILFTDPKLDNHYKRFVRDFMHYKPEIVCAATAIVVELRKISKNLGFDDESYVTYHIRRGDFQYKNVKIPAEDIYENTKELLRENELIFIATDERDKAFFKVFSENGHTVKYLDDFSHAAKLETLNKDYFGMVDSYVAATGRSFVGTWFSTFTGYINRIRGYLLKDDHTSWYFMKQYKSKLQVWTKPHPAWYSREFPTGWYKIDGDKEVTDFDPNDNFEQHNIIRNLE